MHPTQEQLIAYFSGKSSAAEKQLVEDWLRTGADGEKIEESIRQVMESMTESWSETAGPTSRTLRAHEQFLERTRIDGAGEVYPPGEEYAAGDGYSAGDGGLPAERFIHGQRRIGRRRIWRPVLKYVAGVAAAVLLVLAGTGFYRHYLALSARDTIAVTRDIIYQAGKATITRITLTDSSVVRLFPGSALTVSAGFNTTDRKVSITGRGYFEVAHDAARPFYVKTGRMTTTVVGTAFEVNTTDSLVTMVTVKEGKVNVSEGTKVLPSLIHDQSIHFNRLSGDYKLLPADATICCSWIKGEIDFRQVSLREILHSLATWYGVSFEIRRPRLAGKKLTFFIRRQGLKESMDILSAAGVFRYTIDHQKISIQ